MGLILLSVILIILELVIPEGQLLHDVALWAGHGLTAIFAAELGVRFAVAQRKARFFRHYWLDLISILPFARSLRFLRLLRLLRIFRVGMLLSRRLSNISAVFVGAAGELFVIVTIILITILIGAFGLRLTEGTTHATFGTLEQTLWWSVMSLVAGEPIGEIPQTPLGRLFALGVMMAGLTVFAMFTGTVSAVMVGRLRSMDLRTMDLDELRNHVVICGWNRSGRVLLEELATHPEQIQRGVVIVAEFEEDPHLDGVPVDRNLIWIVREDYTRVETLRRVGIPHADVAILLADRTRERSDQDRDARTVLAAIAIERLNDHIFTSVELINRENGAHLKMIGVEEIVVAEEYAGSMMAMATRNRGIVALVEELLSYRVGNSFFKVAPPARFVGRPVRELERFLREEHACILVGLDRVVSGESQGVEVNPDAARLLESEHQAVLIARRPPRFDRR